MLVSTAFISGSAFADEPSLRQVYQAADTGLLHEVAAMMHDRLSTQLNRGKAHFVETELPAKQGQLHQKTEAELATVEHLSPGLSFAKPLAVPDTRELPSPSRSDRAAQVLHDQPEPPDNEPPISWRVPLLGIGLIALIAFARS